MDNSFKSSSRTQMASGQRVRHASTAKFTDSFVAVDTERANNSQTSVIEIGFVVVKAGTIVEELGSLVGYRGFFCPYARRVHKITRADLTKAPSLREVYLQLYARAKQTPYLLHHGGDEPAIFDEIAKEHGLPKLPGQWLNTHTWTRRTWLAFRKSGGSLQTMAKLLGVNSHTAHRAVSDAKICAQIFLEILQHNPELSDKTPPLPITPAHLELMSEQDRKKYLLKALEVTSAARS